MSEQWQARKDCSVCSRKAQKYRSHLISHSVRDFDIGDSIGCLRYYAGWADKILGQVLDLLSLLFMEALTFGLEH